MKTAEQREVLMLENVGKIYPGAVPTRALEGIDCRVGAGEFMAIVGASGSGKTTLLNLLGLLDSPTEGRIRLDGRDVTALTPDEAAHLRRDRMGFIFQFHYLLPEFSALENVLMPCRLAGGGREAAQEAWVRSLFERIGLASKVDRRPHQLSGGEQQRVAILRALANDPLVILADEPTGNLDSRNAAEVFALLQSITRESPRTVIMVTHDRELAEKTDRVLTLRDGRVESDTAAK
jgi:lipoprotein-releasing system ATP-binding protein